MRRLRRFASRRLPYNLPSQDNPSWDERAQAAVRLCRAHWAVITASVDAPVRVQDLGCGNRRLKKTLASELGAPCRYEGFDLHPQDSRTNALNLENNLPSQVAEVVFLLGVCEYIHNLPDLFERLSTHAAYAVVSYVVADSPDPASRSTWERRQRGWVNDYTATEVQRLLQMSGFDVVSTSLVNRQRTLVILCAARAQDGS